MATLGAAGLMMTTVVGCSAVQEKDAAGPPPSRSADPAAASAAETAAPGTYGTPVDPSLPNPTGVATDPPATTAPSETAPVVVTYSGWADGSAAVEFGAYVANVVESGGTCTLTLTAGSATAGMEVSAEPDASSTTCPMMAVAGSELTSGSWQAVVSYESPSTSGHSSPVTVTVP